VHDVGERGVCCDIELVFDRVSDRFDASGAIAEFEDACPHRIEAVQLAPIDHHDQRFTSNDARGGALGFAGN
jgi:hypothetical protein